jgi:hypothetical protein
LVTAPLLRNELGLIFENFIKFHQKNWGKCKSDKFTIKLGVKQIATGPQGHRATGPQGHRVTGLQGHRATGPQNHRATEPQSHRTTGPRATGPQNHRATGSFPNTADPSLLTTLVEFLENYAVLR